MRLKNLNSFFKGVFPKAFLTTLVLSLLLAPGTAFGGERKDIKSEPKPSSNVLFTFQDQSTLTMSEDTVFSINNHVYNPEKNIRETIITVSKGWAHFKATKGKNNEYTYKFVTPSATAGLEGKEFETIVDAKGVTTFRALEGKVETFSNLSTGDKEKSYRISEGEVQNFFPDGTHSPVRPIFKSF